MAPKNSGIAQKLQLVVKSGKFVLGVNQTLKTLRKGTSKLVIISSNTPALKKSEIEYYAMLSKTPVHHFAGNNVALGTSCRRFHQVSVMSITDVGDADLGALVGGADKKKKKSKSK
eukprot:TRINITY_DN66284_c4_g3_i2.p2 TRINITY_DN66284_c4_g3~~TRINITY_DN66284_c4_g3_i2.p2  ORF type:complete len:116 (+),score=62.16 TRINITY_DN66284_c4_g3_i2:107-454(+)